jgi:hypothetical protein
MPPELAATKEHQHAEDVESPARPGRGAAEREYEGADQVQHQQQGLDGGADVDVQADVQAEVGRREHPVMTSR